MSTGSEMVGRDDIRIGSGPKKIRKIHKMMDPVHSEQDPNPTGSQNQWFAA